MELTFIRHNRSMDVVWRIMSVISFKAEVVITAEAWSLGALTAYSLGEVECLHIKTELLKDWAYTEAMDGSFLRYKHWRSASVGAGTTQEVA